MDKRTKEVLNQLRELRAEVKKQNKVVTKKQKDIAELQVQGKVIEEKSLALANQYREDVEKLNARIMEANGKAAEAFQKSIQAAAKLEAVSKLLESWGEEIPEDTEEDTKEETLKVVD